MGVPSIILAGGKSKRMGKDKATLFLNEKTWIENIIEALNSANCIPITISVNSKLDIEKLEKYIQHNNIEWVIDNSNFDGMKGGLITSLEYASKKGWEVVQLVSCDVPQIDSKLFHLFEEIWQAGNYDIVVPSIRDKNSKSKGIQPLLARVLVEPYLAELMNSALADRRIIGPYSKMHVCVVENVELLKFGIKENCIKNFNTPEDII